MKTNLTLVLALIMSTLFVGPANAEVKKYNTWDAAAKATREIDDVTYIFTPKGTSIKDSLDRKQGEDGARLDYKEAKDFAKEMDTDEFTGVIAIWEGGGKKTKNPVPPDDDREEPPKPHVGKLSPPDPPRPGFFKQATAFLGSLINLHVDVNLSQSGQQGWGWDSGRQQHCETRSNWIEPPQYYPQRVVYRQSEPYCEPVPRPRPYCEPQRGGGYSWGNSGGNHSSYTGGNQHQQSRQDQDINIKIDNYLNATNTNTTSSSNGLNANFGGGTGGTSGTTSGPSGSRPPRVPPPLGPNSVAERIRAPGNGSGLVFPQGGNAAVDPNGYRPTGNGSSGGGGGVLSAMRNSRGGGGQRTTTTSGSGGGSRSGGGGGGVLSAMRNSRGGR